MRIMTYIIMAAGLGLLLTSCGFKDIDKRFFVVALGIDRTDNEQKPYRLTLRLAIPSSMVEPGEAKAEVETINTSSIAEGLRMMKSHVDKELDFGHCKIFMLGERLTSEDYRDTLQWMSRRRDIQSVADIAIGRPAAEPVLEIMPQSERYPGNALFLSFGSDGTESSFTYVTSLSELIRRSEENGLDPILPIVTEDKNTYTINRAALLDKKQSKLVLLPSETELFIQLTGSKTKSSTNGMFEGTRLVVGINQLSTRFKIEKRNGTPVIVFHVSMKVILEDAPRGLYDKHWGPIERKLAGEYAEQSIALLRKIQKAGVDPFGFGLRYRAMHPGNGAWEEWKRIYPEADFEVKAKFKIEGTGLIK
ncbi:Ger(x)C family spore germination C-terminal domain-containing protein [Paenibacillus sp. GCM10023252]|uniref:Ger(x)C family spore germination protein n=1 Tax=Paenibacillus sp. GCM10023252 TaxID=3252649 RepID=UPI00360E7E3A